MKLSKLIKRDWRNWNTPSVPSKRSSSQLSSGYDNSEASGIDIKPLKNNPVSVKAVKYKNRVKKAVPTMVQNSTAILNKLKQKYDKDYITSDWLTKNLTWGGKLAKILKIKDVYNFGLGGLGIDAVIRTLFNYTRDIVSLRDHLFVIQIPCSDRKEFLANDYKIHQRENDEIKEDIP